LVKSKQRRRKRNIGRSDSPPKSGNITSEDSPSLSDNLEIILLIIVTFIAYIPAIQGGYIWDDNMYVSQNETLKTFRGLTQIWSDPMATPQYYPLVFSSFWLEYRLWGLDPMGYHIINVLLHATVAVLLYFVLKYLDFKGSWLAALLFALHPINVESVAWITERKNVLSGLFYLCSSILFLKFYRLGNETNQDDHNRRMYYSIGLLTFGCALLSKTVTCTLPLALIVTIWWKRRKVTISELMSFGPLAVLGAAAGLLTAHLERVSVGAEGPAWNLSLIERFLIAGRALCFYVYKLLWPVDLIFNYPRWIVDASAWRQYLFPAASIGIFLFFWSIRGRTGRGPLAALSFFTISLFPALGFFNVFPFRYSFVADHFQYLAGIGVICLVAAGLIRVAGRFPSSRRKAFPLIAALILVSLGLKTWSQAHDYKDLETLWTRTVEKNPASALAYSNLGWMRFNEGRLDEARRFFLEAIRLDPNLGVAHVNLGLIFFAEGNTKEAAIHFDKALSVDPGDSFVQYSYGAFMEKTGNQEVALSHYQEAVRLDPDFALAHLDLGKLLAKRGELTRAIKSLEEALRVKKNWPEAHSALGAAYAALGSDDKAIQSYSAALREAPDYALAHNNLAFILTRNGRLNEAIVHYTEAIKINPGYANAHLNLGIALMLTGDYAKADESFSKAKQFLPNPAEFPSLLKQAESMLHHKGSSPQ